MAHLKAFTMPKWGIEMSEGTIAEWMVGVDEDFDRGTVLTLIETDKITNEVEAEAPGRFVRIFAADGETHAVGALLGVLSDGPADAGDIDAFVARFTAADTSFTGDDSAAEIAATAPEAVSASASISAAALEAAQAAGIDIATIIGTGRDGRISLQDVHLAIQQQQ